MQDEGCTWYKHDCLKGCKGPAYCPIAKLEDVGPKGLRVVFTGPAYDEHAQPVLRADLAAACKALGMVVQNAVGSDTNLLVCSRTDTVKAAKAASRGVPAMTYPTFLALFQVAPKPSKAAIPDRFVDTHRPGPHPSLIGGPEL